MYFTYSADPKYLHEPETSLEKAEEVVKNIIIPQYKKYNHGRWAVYLKETHEFIRWCGLKYRPERQVVDLGYRLSKKYWGHGYATEAAKRCLQYGFEVLNLPKIFAAAHVDNIASRKVLEKAGLHFIGIENIDNCLAKTYEIVAQPVNLEKNNLHQ